MKKILAILVLLCSAPVAQAQERFPILAPDQLTPEQMKLVKSLLAGPRGGGQTDAEAVRGIIRGPFNVWLRSPDLGERLQKVGEYIRYNSSLGLRLNEFAILITARYWTSQYEWYAHYPLAIKAGLDSKVADDLAANRRPANMKEDESAVYDFCMELHQKKNVSDANYQRAVKLFGEKGVMDLVGVSGYYTAVSMTLNVAQVKVPSGPDPLSQADGNPAAADPALTAQSSAQ